MNIYDTTIGLSLQIMCPYSPTFDNQCSYYIYLNRDM